MATISSPRTQSPAPQHVQSPTISHSPSATPSSSLRPSLDLSRFDTRSTSPAPPNTSQRRNKVALRDYYNLKSKPSPGADVSRTASVASITSNGTASTLTALEDSSVYSERRSQLDEVDFDVDSYVQGLLKSANLRTLLRAEASLVSEIKNLDGERKALVYDNYSKFITATQTIGTMRMSMNEAGRGRLGSISMLKPAVDAVVNSAAELRKGNDENDVTQRREQRTSRREEKAKRDTVRWILSTPARLRQSLRMGQLEEAEAAWKEARELLEKWKDVQGSTNLKAECEEIMSRTVPRVVIND